MELQDYLTMNARFKRSEKIVEQSWKTRRQIN